MNTSLSLNSIVCAVTLLGAVTATAQPGGLQSRDLGRLRSVGEVRISPDGGHIAYTVINNNRPGRPYAQVWVMEIASGNPIRFGGPQEVSSNPQWSPDGQWIAYSGGEGEIGRAHV